MSLKSTIESEIKKAMLAKEKDRLKALRSIKSMILLAESEKGASKELSEEEEVKLVSKAAKQRRDSAQIYKEQNREDLYDAEVYELSVIEDFLPKQLSDDELEEKLKAIITDVGAEGPKDMGKVMGRANKELSGQAEGKKIAEKVKSLLSS